MPHSGKLKSSFVSQKINLARYIQLKTISCFFTQVRDLVHQEVSELDHLLESGPAKLVPDFFWLAHHGSSVAQKPQHDAADGQLHGSVESDSHPA